MNRGGIWTAYGNRRSWSRKWAGILGGFLLSMMIPYVLTLLWSGRVEMKSRGLSYSGDLVVADGEEMDVENFLVLVLAGQMEPEAPPEAKQAQAVVARTNLYKTMEEKNDNRAEALGITYGSLAELKEQWGQDFSRVYQTFEAAVSATAGEVLVYNGRLIDALFHKASAGNTRSMGEEYPWLTVVESNDQLCDGYLSVTDFTPQKLADAINTIDSARQVSAEEIGNRIQIVNRADGAYVTAVQVDQQLFDGDEMAGALQLHSTAFSIERYGEQIRVISSGIGHGYGLSQTGAVRMAREGETYQEILSYYYPGAEVTVNH